MSKPMTLIFAGALAVGALAILASSGASNSAGAQHEAGQVSVADLHRAVNMQAMPAQKVDDKSFVFADAD